MKSLRKYIFSRFPAVINPAGRFPSPLKNLTLFILRLIYRERFNHLHIIKIKFGPLKGKKMILNLIPERGAVNTEYIAGYRQEREEINLLKNIIQKGQTIWDIGIYRGFFTLLFSEFTGPSGKVLSFEIDPGNVTVVNEVVRLNNAVNISVYNYGLSNKNTVSEFISSPSSNSRLVETFRGNMSDTPILTAGEQIRTTNLRTFDSLVEEFGAPDIIKVDIDGAELFALDTADRVFENPDLVFIIESHNIETDKKITSFFKKNQCHVYCINEDKFFDNEELFWGAMIASKNPAKLESLKK